MFDLPDDIIDKKLKTQPQPSWARDLVIKMIELNSDIADLKKQVEETNRALRGHNGDIGLIAEVAGLREKVETIMKTAGTIMIFLITTLIGLYLYHVLSTGNISP